MKTLAVFLFVVTLAAQTQPKMCAKGEYLSVDGRCLIDQTGKVMPAGDGCNSATCMDPSCRYAVNTSMYCIHGSDPAFIGPTVQIETGAGVSSVTSPLGAFTVSGTSPNPCGDFGGVMGNDGKCSVTVTFPKLRGFWCAQSKTKSGEPVMTCKWRVAKRGGKK